MFKRVYILCLVSFVSLCAFGVNAGVDPYKSMSLEDRCLGVGFKYIKNVPIITWSYDSIHGGSDIYIANKHYRIFEANSNMKYMLELVKEAYRDSVNVNICVNGDNLEGVNLNNHNIMDDKL